MSAPEVTVIVPTYNGEAYIDPCLESIAAQDLTGVEVLVNDDGSTDRTVEIARAYADRIPGLRVERNAANLGAVANVNRCLELAHGTWVKPVFQDDVIEPGCLATMRAAARPGVPAVVCGRRYIFEEGVPEWQVQACHDLLAESLPQRFGSGLFAPEQVARVAVETVERRLPHLNFVGEPVAVMVERRAALKAGGFDTDYHQLWDYELLVRLGVRRGLVLVDQPLAGFRVHGESQTSRNLAGSAFGINVLDRLRLLTAYARDRGYKRVREEAARHDPPVDVVALAVGSRWAAEQVAAELPADERPAADRALAEVTRPLPTHIPSRWNGRYPASSYAVHLLHELSGDTDAAVGRMYATEPAIDLAEPPPPPGEGTSRTGRLARVGGAFDSLRTNQWWNHMMGPIVAFALLQVGWRDVPLGDSLPRLLALLWSAMALAPYGYVVNDASDVEDDRRVGKTNSMTRLATPVRLAVIVGFAVLGALPWLFVHLEPPALAALAGLYLVPLLYSPRPLRLKENPVLGPIADASNAFVLPSLFTIALFAPLGEAAGPPALMVAGALCWTVGFGLRAILTHQVDDAENDRATGTRTLVTKVGERPVRRVMRLVLFPLDLLGIALLTATVAFWAPWLVGLAVVGVGTFHGLRLTGLVERTTGVTSVRNGWFLSWTQIWPATLLGLALFVQDWRNLVLVGIVLVLFWPRLRSGLRAARHVTRHELTRTRRGRSPDHQDAPT